jgi:hypothetical protein
LCDKGGRFFRFKCAYREDGKVKHETLANLTPLPAAARELLRRSLQGETFVPADTVRVTIVRSLPHGDVAAVMAQARALGLPALLGPAGRSLQRRPRGR